MFHLIFTFPISIFNLPLEFVEIFLAHDTLVYCICYFCLLCVIDKFDKNAISVFIQLTDENIEEDRAEIRLLWKAARTSFQVDMYPLHSNEGSAGLRVTGFGLEHQL